MNLQPTLVANSLEIPIPIYVCDFELEFILTWLHGMLLVLGRPKSVANFANKHLSTYRKGTPSEDQ